MKRLAFAIGALLFAVVGATEITRLTRSPHTDFTYIEPSDHAVALEAGAGWTLERGDTCAGWRIRVGNRTTQCWEGPLHVGDTMAGLQQGEGHHFAFFLFGASVPPRARFFSSGLHSREVTLHALSNSTWLGVVDLGSAKAYGVQFLAHDGTLLISMSLRSP